VWSAEARQMVTSQKWPDTLHCSSSSSISMFCKPCYTQGGIDNTEANEGRLLWKVWKAVGKVLEKIFQIFSIDFCRFKILKNRTYA